MTLPVCIFMRSVCCDPQTALDEHQAVPKLSRGILNLPPQTVCADHKHTRLACIRFLLHSSLVRQTAAASGGLAVPPRRPYSRRSGAEKTLYLHLYCDSVAQCSSEQRGCLYASVPSAMARYCEADDYLLHVCPSLTTAQPP